MVSPRVGLKTTRLKEDLALMTLLVQRQKLSAERFGEIKVAIHTARKTGAAYDPLKALLESGEIALVDWHDLLGQYEREFYCCPSCGAFLRTAERTPQVRCGKCQELFDLPANPSPVSLTGLATPKPPSETLRARQAQLERENLLLRQAVESGLVARKEARWVTEQCRAAANRGQPCDAGLTLVRAGLLDIGQVARLEQKIEAEFARAPETGQLVARGEAGDEAPAPAEVSVVEVSGEPTELCIRDRHGSPRRRRGTARPPRLTHDEAARLRSARDRSEVLARRLQALRESAVTPVPEAAPAAAAAAHEPTPAFQPPLQPRTFAPPPPPAALSERLPEPPPPPIGPTLEGDALAEALKGKVIDLSGHTILEPIDLSRRKLTELNCKKTRFMKPVTLRGATVAEKAVFKDVRFDEELEAREVTFTGGADFSGCEFIGETRFNSARFNRYSNFRLATFASVVRFTRARFPLGGGFDQAEFRDEASFNDVQFGHRAKFEKVSFDKGATFSNATFAEVIDFSSTVFGGPARFMSCNFGQATLFNNVTFRDEANFGRTEFKHEVSFRGACFEGLIGFRAIASTRSIHLQDNTYGDDARFTVSEMHVARLLITRKDLEGRVDSEHRGRFDLARHEYGLLKHNFNQINAYADEDWAYLMEKRSTRKATEMTPSRPLSYLQRFFDWTALDLACGYGTKPLNILIASFVIIALFSPLYILSAGEFVLPDPAAQATAQFGVPEAMLFSFKSFTSSELDIWSPHPTSWLNYIVAFQSFLGIFVMTVLVVTFSRKVIR